MPRATSAPPVDLLTALHQRRSCPQLVEPGPGPDELRELLTAACSAPDHGRLRPWRFIVVDTTALGPLGDVFAAAHVERDPGAGPAELDRTRAKTRRGPMIVVVVGIPGPHPKVPLWEQRASAACVAYGLVLAAHARGYGAMWRTGWLGTAPKVRAYLGLAHGEEVTGWIHLGTPAGPPPAPRALPELPVSYLS